MRAVSFQADFTTLWAPVCARRKVPPGEFTAALAAAIQAQLDANPSPTHLLRGVAGVGPYLNLFLNRPLVFRLTLRCGGLALAGVALTRADA